MGSIPFAFSVHHFINSVGADAGFAAIIGLAVLVLLYFAQARETTSLRDQAHESAQRVQQLEARLAQLGRAQPPGPVDAPSSAGQPGAPSAGRPAPAPPGIPATAAGREQGSQARTQGAQARTPVVETQPDGEARASHPEAQQAARSVPSASAPSASADEGSGSPAAPAGVGAPALTAATRLIPPSEQGATGEQRGASPGAADSSAAGHAASHATPHTAAAAQSPDLPLEDTAFVAAPATAAGSAAVAGALGGGPNGASSEPVAAPTPRARTGEPTPRGPIRPAAAHAPPPRTAPPRPLESDGRPPSRLRRVLPVLIGLIAIVAIVIALVALTSGGTSSNRSAGAGNAASNAPSAHRGAKKGAPKPSSVTVAVLNGTAASGLAHRVAVKLGSAGYKQGTVATATDQTRTATVVAFMPSHRRDALAIASALKLGSASVQPVDANTQAVACPPPAACPVAVVVTVGSDLTNTA